jgi:hypothetical protein
MIEQWNWNDAGEPLAVAERRDAEVDHRSSFAPTFRELTKKAGEISTQVDILTGNNLMTVQLPPVPAPQVFLTGGQLPAFLQTMPDEPTAVWTDRFPGVESELLTAPILLVVHRVDAGRKDSAGKDLSGKDLHGEALHCLEVEINGIGALSRWYFRMDGSLDHADLANGLKLQPKPATEIESTFASEPHLTVHAE